METIIIKLDAGKLENPDLDICYDLPDRIAEYTNHTVTDNGYDYLSGTVLGIWLNAENALRSAALVVELLKTEKFCENDLSETAEIWISAEANASIEICKKVYPE